MQIGLQLTLQMITPKYSFTMQLVNSLATVERLYGQLSQKSLIPSLALKITQENMILATHYSTSIEGNPLNQAEVTNVLLNDKMPINKSEKEVKNYFHALNHISVMAKRHVPITTDFLLELHKYAMEGMEIKRPGEFRDASVVVGHNSITGGIVIKHNPPYHTKEEIIAAMNEIIDWIITDEQTHPWIKAGIFHHEFAYIHPFFDGNGRMARLLTSYFLLMHGYEVTKYFILDDYYDMDRLEYSDKLHSADSGDKTQWLEYFLDGIGYSLTAAIARVDDVADRRVEEITGEKRVLVTPREEEVIQILIEKKAIKTNDVTESFEVTRQQAQSLLHSLVKKGLIEKYGKTKSSYYRLKPTPANQFS